MLELQVSKREKTQSQFEVCGAPTRIPPSGGTVPTVFQRVIFKTNLAKFRRRKNRRCMSGR